MQRADIIVIGAGMVGSAIAYGLARRGRRVVAFDGGDRDFRAARANFGLVWVQGKGDGLPAYQDFTRTSSDRWPDFVAELADRTGQRIDYERRGGLAFCIGEQEFEARSRDLQRLHNQLPAERRDTEMLDRRQLDELAPEAGFGPSVTGASYCWRDGHANPLQLLRGIQAAVTGLGGEIRHGCPVDRIRPAARGFDVHAGDTITRADRVVITAGIESGTLARDVGLDIPVRPQRGQVLVTERLVPFLPLPASGIRQTAEGSIMLGATKEEVGRDVTTTTTAGTRLARRAIEIVPRLASAKLVRHWAGLRVMTPDSYPIYAQSELCPGAFVALCHSGVTLAAAHADLLADAIHAGALPAELDPFHHRRFDVSHAH